MCVKEPLENSPSFFFLMAMPFTEGERWQGVGLVDLLIKTCIKK